MPFFIQDQSDILERYFGHHENHRELIQYLSQTLNDFIAKKIAPHAAKNDQEEKFSEETFRQLGELGYVSLCYPETYGGMNVNPVYYLAGLESLAKGDAGFTLGVAIHGTTCDGINRFASDALKKKYLGDLIAVRKIGAFALSESDSGSDARAMRTSYRRVGNQFLLKGSKFWITNAPSADLFFVLARNQENPEMVSAFLVERNLGSTFQINLIKDKMGVRGSNTGELVFENHPVPENHLIGREGEGFKYAMLMLNGGRNTIGAWSTGIAQGALEKFLHYAHQRKLFGKLLKDLDNTKKEVSEMLLAIKGARELSYAAAYEKALDHKNYAQDAALAKIAGTEASVYVTERVIELSGGYGYLRESNLERPLRDALLGRMGEGANELLKILVIPRIIYQNFADNPPPPNW